MVDTATLPWRDGRLGTDAEPQAVWASCHRRRDGSLTGF